MTRLRYEVPFIAAGERRVIVVDLARWQIDDVLYHRALGRPCADPDGPLPRSYACQNALDVMPDDATPLDIEFGGVRPRPQPVLIVIR
jgi:hypothetical protein